MYLYEHGPITSVNVVCTNKTNHIAVHISPITLVILLFYKLIQIILILFNLRYRCRRCISEMAFYDFTHLFMFACYTR